MATPVMPAPPSVSFVDSEYTSFLVVQSVFIAFAAASVAARLYVRSIIIRKLGLGTYLVSRLLFGTIGHDSRASF